MPGPSEVVRNFCNALLDTMQHAGALGQKGRYQKLEPVLLSTFDVPFMARLSIGPSWYQATPEQKRQAAAAYGRYIGAVYASRFDDYAGQRFEVLGEQRIKHGTLVRTRIIKANGEPVSINYVLHDNDIAWQIRDVYLSGSISELAGKPFASTFNPGMEQSNTAGLAIPCVQGMEKDWVTKNGGLKPGLGLENGPFSCPP